MRTKVRAITCILNCFVNKNIKTIAPSFHSRLCVRAQQSALSFNNRKLFHTTAASLELVQFKLSDIGEGIKEVTIKEWFVKEGDTVAQFDEICEVQSDKASVTITSRYDGVIKNLHYEVDQIALVGAPLVDIETGDVPKEAPKGESKEAPKTSQEVKPQQTTQPPPSKEAPNVPLSSNEPIEKVLTIPSVRRLAAENKVNLANVTATGKNGRILKEDLLKYLSGSQKSATKPQETGKTQQSEEKIEPIKGYRRAMVKTMTAALQIPHMVYSDEVVVTNLVHMRSEMKHLVPGKFTYMPIFIKAVSHALLDFPILNASVDENCENIIYKKSHNIGIAMDSTSGLVVPVIKNVENLNLLEINTELGRLQELGKKEAFSLQDLSGGTFSISNVGAIGGTYVKPVILPPQVALFGISRIQVLPRYCKKTNELKPEHILYVSVSADHRVIDGATLARFTNNWKKLIENPYLLLLKSA